MKDHFAPDFLPYKFWIGGPLSFRFSTHFRVLGSFSAELERAQWHTAHTHTTDQKSSIAPIQTPSPAQPPLTSLREQVLTDNVEAPPHRRKSRGRRPTALKRHHLRRRIQRTDDAEAPCHRHAIRGCPKVPDILVIVARRGG